MEGGYRPCERTNIPRFFFVNLFEFIVIIIF